MSAKRNIILYSFWRSWHRLLCKTLDNTLQCQQWKYSPVEARTHNLYWYLLYNCCVSYIHNSSLTSISVLFWWINLKVLLTSVWSCMLFQHFDWKLKHQIHLILFLYILLSHHLNLRGKPWICTYVGAELTPVVGIFLKKIYIWCDVHLPEGLLLEKLAQCGNQF